MGVVSTSPPQTPNVWNPGPVRPSTNLSNLPAPSARPSFALAPSTTWEDQRRRLLRLRSEVDDLERILLLDPRSAFGPSAARTASELKMRLDALLVARGDRLEGGGGMDAMLGGGRRTCPPSYPGTWSISGDGRRHRRIRRIREAYLSCKRPTGPYLWDTFQT